MFKTRRDGDVMATSSYDERILIDSVVRLEPELDKRDVKMVYDALQHLGYRLVRVV
jgi:hypothetical protein